MADEPRLDEHAWNPSWDRPRVLPEWTELAERGDWLGAAKSAAVSPVAPSGLALAYATIALTEAMTAKKNST